MARVGQIDPRTEALHKARKWPEDTELHRACRTAYCEGAHDSTSAQDALLDEAGKALESMVADILEYERINNLAPSPGKQDCWQSVTFARSTLTKLREGGE